MAFLHPAWLIGLLPWAAVVLYLLVARLRRQAVPFLPLWQHVAAAHKVRRRLAPPSPALALALLAMLLALLAAAGPVLRRAAVAAADEPITLVVDRGISMSARGTAGPRYRELATALVPELARAFGPRRAVQLYTVPAAAAGPVACDVGGVASIVDRIEPTAVDARAAVRRLVRDRSSQTGGPIVVVSDADLGVSDDRLAQVAPSSPIRNVAVTALAARAAPRPQVMVRLRNDSAQTAARLVVEAAGRATELAIDLPPAGSERDWFVDVPALGDLVTAEVKVDDDVAADNRRWLIVAGWPRVEPIGPIGDLQRLVASYQSVRPAAPGSPSVRVAAGPAGLGDAAGVAVYPGGADESAPVRPTGIRPHRITDGVPDWTTLDLPLGTRDAPPPGWTPVLWAGGRPLVAVREEPARQVWVALDTNRWSDAPQYVVFWSAVLDWAGRAGADEPPRSLSEWTLDWRPVDADAARAAGTWPGVYERADGLRRVFVAAPLEASAPRAVHWRAAVRALAVPRTGQAAWREVGPITSVMAVACVLLASLTWPRRPTESYASGKRRARHDRRSARFSG